MEKKYRNLRSILLLFILVLCFLFGYETGKQQESKNVSYSNNTNSNSTDNSDLFFADHDDDLFWDIWNALDEDYYNHNVLDTEKMNYGAIKGMVAALEDPYTLFMDPEETESFQNNLNGELEGIGAELTMEDGILTVITPLKNSPAEREGIKAGDIVYMIDDEFATDMTFFEAILKIRGETGTKVKLTILREGAEEPIEIEIVREKVELNSIEYEYFEDSDIAYVDVLQFSDNTTNEFSNAVSEILLKDVEGLILDLRYNGGGYLAISVDMISEFLPEEYEAVTIRRKNEEENEIIYTLGNPRLPDVPVVVLVNEGTASASEIVAGAIQDHKRGIVIGTQTYGKGSVQEVKNFEDGSSLRLTVAKWFTPNDVNIDEVGITPNIEIEFTPEDIEAERDVQLEEAINYLENFEVQ